MVAALTDGAAARSKSPRRLMRGNCASWTRRWRRRSPRSSTSAARRLGQVAEIGGVAALRHLGQAHALGAHRRQVQLPGGRPDGGFGCGVGHLGHHPTPNRSS